tara:strand:+ start:28301 stop:29953 length:1653 start_codon:yes stop_codon:yes gene_type:complete
LIISRCLDGKHIYKSWRENGEKKFELIPFRPYFFVNNSETEHRTYAPNKYIEREFEYETGDWVNIDGERLKKVYVENSFDIRKAKSKFSKTYEADVPYTFRYAVDEIHEMPEYKMRKWYWDMEWQQGGEHHNEITTIVMYDNYDEKYYQWIWFPNGKSNGFSTLQYKQMYAFNSEKEMLEHFINTMIDKDPDMLIAWFGNFADIPKLLERCCALGINPNRMSPINRVDGLKKTKDGYKYNRGEKGFSPIEQPIGGRITLSLDMAFERQWNDSQRGTLPSLSLDYVSESLLNKKKLVSEKFPDPNEFYRRGWLEDSETYSQYALKDVELIVEIDETNYCSEAIIALQRLLKAPFDACFYASHMGSIYFMRNAYWKAPTGNKNEKKQSYQGAMIYDPLSEDTNGLHLNVAAFDFAGLYPSMMIARNISWETISDKPTEFAVNILTPRDFSEPVAEDMVYFKTDKLGVLPRAVLELKELRNSYKSNMKNAQTEDEFRKWYNNQMAVKRLSASFYGIIGYTGFSWANPKLAASITASAREAIRLAAFKAKEMKI